MADIEALLAAADEFVADEREQWKPVKHNPYQSETEYHLAVAWLVEELAAALRAALKDGKP